MNYPNTRGEYANAAEPCNHLWRAVVLDGRPIGVTCEGPCGTSIPVAEPPNPNTEGPPPWVVRIGAPLRVHLGIDGKGHDIEQTMILQHVEHSRDGTRMEFVDQLSQVEKNAISLRDSLMAEKVELEKEVEEIVKKRMGEQTAKEFKEMEDTAFSRADNLRARMERGMVSQQTLRNQMTAASLPGNQEIVRQMMEDEREAEILDRIAKHGKSH